MGDKKNKSASGQDCAEQEQLTAVNELEESGTEDIPPENEIESALEEDPKTDTAGTAAETVEASEVDEITSKDEMIESLNQEIEFLKQKVEENLDRAVRAQAELDNVRKRMTRDIENAHKYALEKFLGDLIPVLDSMELGKTAIEATEDISSLKEGQELTYKMLCDTLEKYGIREVNPLNDKFNPEFHEAVTIQELEGKDSGTVISVMQKGYELNGRLIRPAMVIVAK